MRAVQYKWSGGTSSKLLSFTRAISNARHFVGLTGSLSKSSKFVWETSLHDRPHIICDFNVSNFKPPKFTEVKTYIQGEMKETVQEHIIEKLANGQSVILIDTTMQHNETSFLESQIGGTQYNLLVFNDMTDNGNVKNNRNLDTCNSDKGQVLVHTRATGGRGIDFKLYKNAHIVFLGEPKSIQELRQAMGRGFRNLEQQPSGTLFVWNLGHYGTSADIDSVEKAIVIKETDMIKHHRHRAWL